MCTRIGVIAMITIVVLLPISQLVNADSVISTTNVEILEAGSFEVASDWEITSTTGFTEDYADHTVGMVADGELSFTHSRPDNFEEFTAWASESSTGSNATFDEPDSYYSWSRGPEITMSGYSYTGMHSLLIENVSLVLHFSIPDALTADEVNVLLQNHGSDKLVRTFANTLSGTNRMINPLVIPLDEFVDWDWADLEGTQFTVDYVSDNSGPDDSEVRVDAVGLRVKYHQPWYSFENSKARHSVEGVTSPVLDFGPYDGKIEGLVQETCGLSPDSSGDSHWGFDFEVPPNQTLGRIHVFGSGNHTIWFLTNDLSGEYTEIQSGQLIGGMGSMHHIRIDILDGCVSGARVDINDPQLIVSGRISGSVAGLSSASYVRFSVGEELVHTEPMEVGWFSISVPVGHALPESGGTLEIGVAARFQWSSNGTSEATVVHIYSMSVSGGYEVVWDRNPECIELEDLHLIEDEGGLIIPMMSRCNDDVTESQDLIVSAQSSNSSILEVSGEGNDLIIQPMGDAFGSVDVNVGITDGGGNAWSDTFTVHIAPVPDPPSITGLPLTVFIELGETATIETEISDPDSEALVISTSSSWASVDNQGVISITPVEAGAHVLNIKVSDGTTELSQEIEVIVSARPDLLVESLEVRVSGVQSDSFLEGDVVEIVGFIRNEGRGSAFDVSVHCRVGGVLVGSTSIEEIEPGGLKMAVCDVQLIESGSGLEILVEVDGTDSVSETSESNNILVGDIIVEPPKSRGGGSDPVSIAIIISIGVIIGSVVLLQIGPRPVKKEFERRK